MTIYVSPERVDAYADYIRPYDSATMHWDGVGSFNAVVGSAEEV